MCSLSKIWCLPLEWSGLASMFPCVWGMSAKKFWHCGCHRTLAFWSMVVFLFFIFNKRFSFSFMLLNHRPQSIFICWHFNLLLGFFLYAALAASSELDAHSTPIQLDASQFHGSMHKGKDESDTNCWTSPSGQGFMIRGKTYLKDYAKVNCYIQYLHSFNVN